MTALAMIYQNRPAMERVDRPSEFKSDAMDTLACVSLSIFYRHL